jgi:hypothetical protein
MVLTNILLFICYSQLAVIEDIPHVFTVNNSDKLTEQFMILSRKMSRPPVEN